MITNAQTIRGMSDGELVALLLEDGFNCEGQCSEHDPMGKYFGTKCSGKCNERCLEWLQKPAEGNK